jgi:hypothetical protein
MIRQGNTEINAIFLGNIAVQDVFLGDVKIYPIVPVPTFEPYTIDNWSSQTYNILGPVFKAETDPRMTLIKSEF